MLPIEAEAEAMITFLPHEAIGQLVATSAERNHARISERETSVGYRDPRRPQAETARTVFRSRAPRRSVVEEVREPEVVHDAGRQHAGECHQALTRLICLADPTRWQGIGREEVSECAIAVVCVTGKGVVLGIETHVRAHAELIAEIRAGEDSAERGELGGARLNRGDAALVLTLVAGEEEGPIPSDGAAHAEAELLPLEERMWVAGVPPQAGKGGQVLVPVKEESVAVIVVAARARHNIDRTIAREAGRDIEVDGRTLTPTARDAGCA